MRALCVALIAIALCVGARPEPPPAAPVSSKFFDDVLDAIAGVFDGDDDTSGVAAVSANVCISLDALVFFDWDRCMHGRNCGAGCDHGTPTDALDVACHVHHACTSAAHDGWARCECHASMRLEVAKLAASADDCAASARLVLASVTVQQSVDDC